MTDEIEIDMDKVSTKIHNAVAPKLIHNLVRTGLITGPKDTCVLLESVCTGVLAFLALNCRDAMADKDQTEEEFADKLVEALANGIRERLPELMRLNKEQTNEAQG